MIRLFLTIVICIGIIAACNAQQQATNPAFQDKVALLMNDISQKNIVGANLVFGQLNTTMSSQISYLTTFINNLQATYNNDTAKAGRDYRVAVTDTIQAHNEMVAALSANGGSNSSASILARKKATSDMAAAQNAITAASGEMQLAKNEQTVIIRNARVLTIQQESYNALQPLKANLAANRANISRYLNQFAGTL